MDKHGQVGSCRSKRKIKKDAAKSQREIGRMSFALSPQGGSGELEIRAGSSDPKQTEAAGKNNLS